MSASTARQAVPAVTRRSYVALSNYNSALYNYSYGLDEQLLREVGSLTLNPLATAQNCPKGAILHENGRKLNPADGNFRGANDGVATLMVGVYDPVNGVSGFIDPNGPLFGLQNTDKPIYLNDTDYLGNGILTNGTIETTQSVKAGTSVTAGTSVAAGTSVSAGTSVTATTTCSAQKFLTSPVASTRGTALAPLTASAGSANLDGGGFDTVVYTTQVTSSSMVFVTVNNVGPRKVSVVPANGSFTVYTDVNNDNSTFYWLVIN
jgi:hypothetical protein